MSTRHYLTAFYRGYPQGRHRYREKVINLWSGQRRFILWIYQSHVLAARLHDPLGHFMVLRSSLWPTPAERTRLNLILEKFSLGSLQRRVNHRKQLIFVPSEQATTVLVVGRPWTGQLLFRISPPEVEESPPSIQQCLAARLDAIPFSTAPIWEKDILWKQKALPLTIPESASP